jgi:hypothetical protein
LFDERVGTILAAGCDFSAPIASGVVLRSGHSGYAILGHLNSIDRAEKSNEFTAFRLFFLI